jgi:streptogramin lyase
MRSRWIAVRSAWHAAVAIAVAVALLGAGSLAVAATAWTIDEFPVPTAFSLPNEIASGPDGNVWFTERSAGAVARVTPDGTVTEFPFADPDSRPEGIAAGPDGNLWVALRNANAIARVTPTGATTSFALSADAAPMDLTPFLPALRTIDRQVLPFSVANHVECHAHSGRTHFAIELHGSANVLTVNRRNDVSGFEPSFFRR